MKWLKSVSPSYLSTSCKKIGQLSKNCDLQPHSKFTKDILQKTPKNLKIALNSTKNNNSSKMNQELSTLPFKDPSYQIKSTSGQNQLPTRTHFSWNFAFRGLDFMEFPLSDQNSKKIHIYVLKRFYCTFFELIVCLHWFNTEIGRFWPKF